MAIYFWNLCTDAIAIRITQQTALNESADEKMFSSTKLIIRATLTRPTRLFNKVFGFLSQFCSEMRSQKALVKLDMKLFIQHTVALVVFVWNPEIPSQTGCYQFSGAWSAKNFFHFVVLALNKEVTLPFRYNKGNNNTEVYGNAITLKPVTFVGNTLGSTVCVPTLKPTFEI